MIEDGPGTYRGDCAPTLPLGPPSILGGGTMLASTSKEARARLVQAEWHLEDEWTTCVMVRKSYPASRGEW